MKITLDTNVLFAAFASRGLCEALVAMCIQDHELIISDYILDELAAHLHGKLRMTPAEVDERLYFLRSYATCVQPADVPLTACNDPDDIQIIGTALAGDSVLVTGDAALQSIKRYDTVEILSPREFYDRLAK